MEEVIVQIETQVNPTENPEKIKTALRNIFGEVTVSISPEGKDNVLVANVAGQDSLIKFRNLLRSDRIRDAARKALFRSIKGNTISFCLNKQVAFAGHVSFSQETAESPLGPIRVEIASSNSRKLIEWLAEKTA